MLVRYMDVGYAYLHNLQGDVTGLVDMNGATVVEYGYDARGKPVSTEGSMAEPLGKDNPFRYRGYVWDEETGLRSWQLNSLTRIGKYMNVDIILGISEQLRRYNRCIYCNNQPITRCDPYGKYAIENLDFSLLSNNFTDAWQNEGRIEEQYMLVTAEHPWM